MILENKGEVDTPIVSKIEKDFNCSLVFILLLEGKVVSFIVPLCCVSHVTRAASASDFSLCVCFDWFVGVATWYLIEGY
jgi:undecaprenyl pyrophosphate phosphatase UppP